MSKMRAIVVTDQAAGTAVMTLAERPEPPAAINDVIVQIHASGSVPTEIVQRVRGGRLRTNIGNVATLDMSLRPTDARERRSSAFVRTTRDSKRKAGKLTGVSYMRVGLDWRVQSCSIAGTTSPGGGIASISFRNGRTLAR
jgi:hypothetical protein